MKSYRVVAVLRDGTTRQSSFSRSIEAGEKALAQYEAWKLDTRALFIGLWEEDGDAPLEWSAGL